MTSDAPATISAEILRSLHRLQRQKSDLQTRLSRGPRQLLAGEATVAAATEAADSAKRTLQQARIAVDEKQLQLKSREGRLEDLQAKLNQASSNKEYAALKEQMAADEQANLVLSDEILEALERIDTLEEQLRQRDQELVQRREDHQRLCAQVTERTGGLESELQRVSAEFDEVEAQLPESVRAEFRRVASSRGEDALAAVEEGCCGGCYQQLSHQMLNRLHLSQLVRCSSCGALLYLPEDRTVR